MATKTAKQLVKQYHGLQKRKSKLDEDFKTLQKEAKAGKCDHSISHDTVWRRGNGYGSTRETPHRTCLICGQNFLRYGSNDVWRPYEDADLSWDDD
jgi:hypothetical protein